MFVLMSRLYNKFFPEVAKCQARRREARYAEQAARRRLTHFVRPRLEGLEDRELLDAYGFVNIVTGNPAIGSYMNGDDWTDFTNAAGSGKVPGAGDTGDIPTGAVCGLDNSADEQGLAGLTIEGSMTIQSGLTVQSGGSGGGTTSVSGGGLLTVATPDIPGTSSKLETGTLNTAASGGVINLFINDNATVEVDNAGTLGGKTQITGLFDAKNIDAFTGAIVALNGPGTVGGTGQMEAGINAAININSLWTILAGNPVGSALKDGNFFVNGELDTNTDLNPDGHITLNPGGTIGGTGDLSVVAEFTFLGGTLGPDDGTTIQSSGDFKTDGAGSKVLATDLISETAFNSLGGTGSLFIDTGATFEVAAGTVDVTLPSIASMGGVFQVDSLGTLAIKTPAAGTTTISSNFVNTGTLETDGGELILVAGPSGDTLEGTWSLGDDVTLEGTFTSSGFILNAGLGRLKIGDGVISSASLTVPSGVTDDVFGTLEVTHNGTLSGAGEVYSNGTVEVDLGGTASIGSYQQGSSGTLKLHSVMGSGINSKLAVSGTAQLSGILDMEFDSGYMPKPGDTFTVLTAGSIGAHFDTTPPDMTVDYTSTSVGLTQN